MAIHTGEAGRVQEVIRIQTPKMKRGWTLKEKRKRNAEICRLMRAKPNMTYKEVGERYGISIGRVRQIWEKSLK